MKEKIMFFVRLVVGLGIIFVLFKIVPYGQLKQSLINADLRLIVLSFFVFASLFFITAFRWLWILRCGNIHISYWDSVYLLLCGLFFNLFCPSIIAADVFRTSFIRMRQKDAATKVASTVIMDRVTGFVGLFMVSLIAVLCVPSIAKDRVVFIALAFLLSLLLGLNFFIFNQKFAQFCLFFIKWLPFLHRPISRLAHQLHFFKNHPWVYLRCVLLSMLIHGGVVLSFYINAMALHVDSSIGYFAVVVPMTIVLSVLPISVAGLGTREAGSVYFFAKIGVLKSVALGISLLNFVFMVLSGLIGGVLYVAFSHRWLQSNEKDAVAKVS